MGMKIIDKKDFYNIINDLDICVYSKLSDDKKLMTTRFTYRNGILFGISEHNYDLDSDDYDKQVYKIVE